MQLTEYEMNEPIYPRRRTRTVAQMAVFGLLALVAGCGKSEATWPSNAADDWARNVSGKGMANVWSVIFDVAGIDDADVSINADVTLGPSFEETVGKNEIFFGKKVVKLETTRTKQLMLSINGKNYGKIRLQSRVVVDPEGAVYINQELRKPVR